jgi:acetolactate synthase-1/2/3 large subunit
MSTGADRLCAALTSHGVDCVFGVPGTQTIPLYEGLRRSSIRSVLATNELAAGFMANGYFRASGRIAPLLTIPGPGFTYALTAVAEALHDSVPLLHIVACTPTPDGRQHLQAIDQPAVAGPLVKGCFRIDDTEVLDSVVARAFALAISDEPGPVLLEWLPKALLAPAPKKNDAAPASSAPSGAVLTDIYSVLEAAERPLIVVGQGCAGVARELQELAELLGAPVVTTASARGLIPEDHRLAMCFESERGNAARLNDFVKRADCTLVLGAKLGYSGSGGFVLKLPEDRLIKVDTCAESLHGTYPARHVVKERAERFVPGLLAWLEGRPGRPRSQWTHDELAEVKRGLRSVSRNLPEPRG